MADVIVIGGGIVGSSAAYRLARAGREVILVDRIDMGQATAAGAGIISPGTSFRPPPPFYPLAAKAVEFYPQLVKQLAEDGESDTGYATVGGLFVAVNDAEMERLPELVSIVEERVSSGVQGIGNVTLLTGREAKELFPALADVRGAFHVTGSSRMDGRSMRLALQRTAERRGTRILHGEAVPRRVRNRIRHVEVDGERLTAEVVLFAGGAWSNALGEEAGVRIPVYPQRGQILHLVMPETETGHWPVVIGFHTHYIVTFPPSRVVAGATREDDSGYDYRMTAGGVHEALSEALRIAPGLRRATLHEVRIGFRPASPDKLPIMGLAPDVENLYLATGHGASGLQLGPYSGAAVADLILGKDVALDLSPFSPERFRYVNAPGARASA